MNRNLIPLISLLVAGTFSTLASAQHANSLKPYVGVEFGRVSFKDQTTVASVLVNAVGGSASSVQDTGFSIGRYFAGLNVNENFGAEVAYIYSSTASATFSGVSRTAVAYTGTSTLLTSGVDYSVLVRPSVSSGVNGLFARIGGHSLSVKNEVTLLTGTTSGAASATTSGTGLLYGVGYDGKISDKVDFRVGWTMYNTVAGITGNDNSSFTVGILAKF